MKILRPALLTASISFIAAQVIGALIADKLGFENGILSWKIAGYIFNWQIVSTTFWIYTLTCLTIVAATLWQRRTVNPHTLATNTATPALGMIALAVITYLSTDLCLGANGFTPLQYPISLVVIAMLLFTAWRIPPGRIITMVNNIGGNQAWPLIVAMGAAALTLFAQWDIYHGFSIVGDTQAQMAQAILISSGHFTLNISQELRDVISFPYATKTVPSFSQYSPGYILPLALFHTLGITWETLDMLTAGILAGVVTWTAQRGGGAKATMLAGLLLLGCSYFIMMAASGMNHLLCATLLTAVIPLLTPGIIRKHHIKAAFFAGIFLGWAVMVRPLTGLAHIVVWVGVWLTMAAAHRAQLPNLTRRAAATAAGIAGPAVIFLAYNYLTAGSPLTMGYSQTNQELHRLGFHGGTMPYTPLNAWHNLGASIISLHKFLLLPAIGGALTVGLLWLMRTRFTRIERVIIALCLAQTAAYMLYQYFDLLLGARFLSELVPPAIIALSIGLTTPALIPKQKSGDLLWLGVFVFIIGNAIFDWGLWKHKFDLFIRFNTKLNAYVQPHYVEALAKPPGKITVIALESEPETEMMGRFFAPGRVWFILEKNIPKARLLPELKDADWIVDRDPALRW